MSLQAEQIEKNWNQFESLLTTKIGSRNEAGKRLCDELGERIALCPASGRTDFHNAFPGGLVEHSLRVLKNCLKITKAYGYKGHVTNESLIIGALLHDIGKIGSPEVNGDYYVPNESEWHRKNQGKMYEHNDAIQYMTVPDRGVWLASHYGFNLTADEFLAIRLNDGWIVQENKPYCLKEPLLAHIIMTADYISTMQEKGRLPVVDSPNDG